ncbi:uncharacterized protein [Apostichopus japonicus]|uniref:uncharacterized protein isoform X3 n=1 Tax=Stichopus japonicus TaxID=307972 RepID=UPI003AB2BBAC
MMPRIFFLLVDLTFYFLVYCNGQSARFDMTLLDRGPLRAESDASDNNEYQCYLGNPDTSKDSMKSYRVGWTRDIATENPEPGDMEFTDQGNKWSVDLDVSNNNAFGVFGCNATRDGEWDRTEISTVRMVSNADVVPTVPLYTQTVNVGDLDIIIRMEIRNGKDVANLRWIHNNKIITAADGKDTYVFNDPIEEKDAGIYECYIDGERNLAKHGIHLLIVRACPANRWGPPDCFGVCDICYNGGVCDDYNGKCMCLSGFGGNNCEIMCGYNRFGHDCGFQCSWIEDEAIKCKSNLFCRPHPLGCTCITGFEGLDCMEDCSTGTYGASCLQTCHCESGECDQFTGSCILPSCEFGWSGINCQVPHICPVDYFGGDCTFKCRCKDSCDKLSGACSTADCDAGYKIYDGSSICTECQGQTFGENCAENCHCYESYCNKVTGSCNGGCDNEWVDLFPPNNCQTGLVDATFTKVNPGVAVPVHCTAIEGPGGDLDTLDLVLSWHPIGLQNEDIKYNGTMEDTNVKINTFIVDNVLEGHWLFCQLRARGTMVAVLDVTIEFYALPCDHQAPAGEMVERDPQGSGPFQDGTIVVYTCPDGYNLVGDTTAVCQNGKWTVEEEPTCEEIFLRTCPFEMLSYSGVQLTFRSTFPGTSANSTQSCSRDSSYAKQPLSGRFCGHHGWEEPVLTKCYSSKDATDEIERIANTTVTEENVEEVAGDLALITTQTDDLDASEIEDVARSLEDIANANSSSPEVTQSVLGTVNNLMEVDEDELGKETQGSSSVIISLEQQVSNVQENPGNFTDVQVNVGVQAVKVNPSITNAITFISLSPTKNTHQDVQNADLSEENTILHNDEREIQTDNSLTSIFVPSIILEQALIVDPNISYVPISFIIYKDSRLFQTNMASNDTYRQAIASQVISATLEVDKVVIENLTDDDRIISRFMITPQLEGIDSNEVVIEKTCVFWLVQPGSKSGIWSDDGCLTSTDNNHTVCMCSHLTSFAVLVGIETDNPTLNVIMWIGSSLSIAGLVASALTLSLIKEMRQKHSSQININLCVSLMAFYITFLAGDLAKTSPRHCRNIATAIHYFCLATVGWMTVEAVHMYLLFLKFQSQKAFQLKFKYFVPVSAALVYGLSLVPVLVVFFKSSDQSMEYCFLPTGKGLYFGLLVEILIMVVFNIGVFILLLRRIVFRPMMKSSATRNNKKEMLARMQQFILFWVLLGLSWIFGFLAVIPNRKTYLFEILFCILTSLQGIVLFIFICAKNPEVKKAFKKTSSFFSEWNITNTKMSYTVNSTTDSTIALETSSDK